MHILHGHPSGTQLLILNLKAFRDSDSFISFGTKSHIFGPREKPNSVPCQTEFTLILLNGLLLQRSYDLILVEKISFTISGTILFLALNISAAKACIFALSKLSEKRGII